MPEQEQPVPTEEAGGAEAAAGANSNTAHSIELASGLYLDMLDPDPRWIRVEDIAHGLSMSCRFAGQVSRFYSVAEHAVIVSDYLRRKGHGTLVQLQALHHDDTEAYLADIAKPLKNLIPQYKEIEARMEAAVFEGLGLPEIDEASKRIIKEADLWALSAEAYHLMPSRGRGWFSDGLFNPEQPVVPNLRWMGLAPRKAEQAWLRLHDRLLAESA